MHDRWFYCPDLRVGTTALDEGETRHATRSLRLRPGAAIMLFDGRGHVAEAEVVADSGVAARADEPRGRGRTRSDRGLRVQVEAVEEVPRPRHELALLVAACKGPRLDWMVEKCTELGVSRLWLTQFEHSVVRLRAEQAGRVARTAVEACKQCHRAWLPEIRAGLTLTEALGQVGAGSLAVAHPEAEAQSLGRWLSGLDGKAGLSVVIGPEGGLAPAELAELRAAGGQTVSLGPQVLRVETAALAVAAAWASGS